MKRKALLITFALGLGLTLALLLLLGSSSSVRAVPAAELRVCPSGCAFSSIQAAVDAATSGDVVKVAQGTYTDVHARAGITQVVYISKTVTLRGGYTPADWDTPDPEVNLTTLDAQGLGRVIYVTGDFSITIEGFNITGGNAKGLGGEPLGGDAGGGALIISATVVMSNNRVLSNTAHAGGGLCFYNSPYATLTGNMVSNNKVEGGWHMAGGLFFYNSPAATLTANTISNNMVPSTGPGQKHFGGALFDHSDNATLIDNIISGNSTANSCGGVCFNTSDGVTLIDNVIISNTRLAGWDGFGIGVYLNNSKNASLVNNLISENAGQSIDNLGTILGGGLHIGNNSSATLISNEISLNGATRGGGLNIANSTVTMVSNVVIGNAAYDSRGIWNYHPGGGGLYLNNSTVTLTNAFITDNQTETEGSGLYVEGSSLRLLHTTIARNSGGDGSGIYITGTFSSVALTNTILVSHSAGVTVAAGNTVTLEATLWHGNGADTGGEGTVLTGTVNVYDDPAFVDPAAWDYHLGTDSAAINAGVDAGVTADIDGDPRPWPPGGGYDIGADEFLKRVYLPLLVKQ